MDLFNRRGRGIAGLNVKFKVAVILPAIVILIGSNLLKMKELGVLAVVYILIVEFIVRKKDKNNKGE